MTDVGAAGASGPRAVSQSGWRRTWAAWAATSVQSRDVWIAVLLGVLLLGWIASDGGSVPELVLAGVASAALAWRRTNPRVALAVTGAAVVLGTVDVGIGSGTVLQALVAIYSAISVGRRGLGTAVAFGLGLAMAAIVALRGDPWDTAQVATLAAMLALTVALGLWSQSRQATLVVARDRADQAERTREMQAARAVAEERLRIARELHDGLGHQVAIINVHAGVAEALLTTDPEQARESLRSVQDATGTVLRELGTLVEVLRDPGEAAPRSPAPGLGSLDELLTGARSMGLQVEVSSAGPWPPRLAPLVDLIAFRIVQECLTNAAKHGPGYARLALVTTPTTLSIEATNPVDLTGATPRAAAAAVGGHGLIGLHERATSVGGSFQASQNGDLFRARAELPTLALHPAGDASPGNGEAGRITP